MGKRTKTNKLLEAVLERDLEQTKSLVANGFDVERKDGQGRTALMEATQAGANPNAHDRQGYTALHFAAQNYQPGIARVLIDGGATVDAADGVGNTPLWRSVCASKGRGEVIRLLLEAGAGASSPALPVCAVRPSRSSSPFAAVPRELSELGLRQEQWRSQQGGQRARRLPEECWGEAAKLGERHGFARVASVLQVNATVLRGKSGGAVRPLSKWRCRRRWRWASARSRWKRGMARCARDESHVSGGDGATGAGGGGVIQITPQMPVMVAIDAIDGRKGIDSIAAVCRERLQSDPLSGCVFIFRTRAGSAIKVLIYEGRGFWLATMRLSKGRFRWWPQGEVSCALEAHQALVLLAAGNPEVKSVPAWRRV